MGFPFPVLDELVWSLFLAVCVCGGGGGKRTSANAGPNDDKKERKKKVLSKLQSKKESCFMDPSTTPRTKEREGRKGEDDGGL
jgi:hypothetical protein